MHRIRYATYVRVQPVRFDRPNPRSETTFIVQCHEVACRTTPPSSHSAAVISTASATPPAPQPAGPHVDPDDEAAAVGGGEQSGNDPQRSGGARRRGLGKIYRVRDLVVARERGGHFQARRLHSPRHIVFFPLQQWVERHSQAGREDSHSHDS